MRFSIFSVADHYPEEPRTIRELYAQILDEIELADELGFSAFFLAEHHFLGGTVEQIRHRGAGPGNRVVRATACEKRTVGIRIRFEEILLHGVHHLARNLSSGRSIEKRSLLPVHL